MGKVPSPGFLGDPAPLGLPEVGRAVSPGQAWMAIWAGGFSDRASSTLWEKQKKTAAGRQSGWLASKCHLNYCESQRASKFGPKHPSCVATIIIFDQPIQNSNSFLPGPP